ncbi:Serine/threonine-protein phosphatase [Rhodovastum atsumiense]|nr:Serine/threonine-protein phosphatase [Rhodovastum atsumiense]
MAVMTAVRRFLRTLAPAGTATAARLAVTGAMRSHPGRTRGTNEDAMLFDLPSPSTPQARRGALLLVADGMGGHAAGEVASALAARTVHRLFYAAEGPVPDVLGQCFVAANDAIRRHARGAPECKGMGTTCTVLAIRQDRAWLGHVGDSRAYLLRDGTLSQLSEDHTLVAELVRLGRLTAAQAAASPERNVLVRALGTRPVVAPLVWAEGLALRPGDRLVLCSDGLHDLVDAAEIVRSVGRLAPDAACEALVEAALREGGHDNISVGVFAVEEAAERPVPAVCGRPTRRIAP